MNNPVIGVLGTSQIEHLIPVLRKRYEVVDIRSILGDASKPVKFWRYRQALDGVDIIYNVFTAKSFLIKSRMAKKRGIRVVTHWIGSDVRFAQEGLVDVTEFDGLVDQHVSCFAPLQKKLLAMGIDAPVLPIVPFDMDFEICEMPLKHAVLVYLPEGREATYGFEDIKKVFERFDSLPFYIVANSNERLFRDFENVHVMGSLNLKEMGELYKKVSVLLRMHWSDGLSMMVLEALGKGKSVIWDHEFNYVLPGKNAEEIACSLEKVISEPPSIRQDAHDFIAQEYTKDRFLEDFDRLVVKG